MTKTCISGKPCLEELRRLHLPELHGPAVLVPKIHLLAIDVQHSGGKVAGGRS